MNKAPVTMDKRHIARPVSEYAEPDEEAGKFHIDRKDFPVGFDLQWVAVDVWGQPQPSMRAAYEKHGWVSVHTGEFNGMYDGKFVPRSHEGEIKVDGLVLMARSKAWSDKAAEITKRQAENQVKIKMNQLRMGELEGISAPGFDPRHKTALNYNHVNASVETVRVGSAPEDK